MKQLISFYFTCNSWKITCLENGLIVDYTFNTEEEAQQFSQENNFNLVFHICP